MALIALAISAFAASSASAIGIGNWEAGTCKAATCTYAGDPAEFYAQAAGHPAFGVTDFTVNVEGGDQAKRVKVELPQGLNVNPQAVPQCPVETFKTNEAACAASKVGTSEVTTEPQLWCCSKRRSRSPSTSTTWSRTNGEPALFGFHVTTPLLAIDQRVRLPRNGDRMGGRLPRVVLHQQHRSVPAAGREQTEIRRHAPGGNFLTLPSPCNGTSSSTLELESQAGATAGPQATTPPVPIAGCAAVPFAPTRHRGRERVDRLLLDGDGLAEHAAASRRAAEINSSTVKNANVTLPVGDRPQPGDRARARILPGRRIPAALAKRRSPARPKSQIGTVAIEAPELPAGLAEGPGLPGRTEEPRTAVGAGVPDLLQRRIGAVRGPGPRGRQGEGEPDHRPADRRIHRTAAGRLQLGDADLRADGETRDPGAEQPAALHQHRDLERRPVLDRRDDRRPRRPN